MSEPPARTSMPPRDTSPPPEDLSVSESEPVEEAGRAAILDRITELERAEAISQEPQPPQFATEPPEQDPLEQVLATMPEGVRGWLRARSAVSTRPRKERANSARSSRCCARDWRRRIRRSLLRSGLSTILVCDHSASHSNRPVRLPRPAMRQQTSVVRPADAGQHFDVNRQTDRQGALTGEEREFAAMVGLSDAEYAERNNAC